MEKKQEETYYSIVISLFSLLILLHLINIFLQSNVITYITGILAIFSLIIAYFKTDKLYRYIGSLFIIIGISIFIFQQKSLQLIPYKMTSMLDLLGLIFILPFITSIIKVGKYEHSVNKLLKTNVKDLGQVYYRSSFSTFLLGSFLNIGTLPLLINVLKKNLSNVKNSLKNMLISQTTLRAYAICLIWSPMEILVVMTVDLTDVSYTTYLPWLLLLSTFLLLSDWLIGLKYKKFNYQLEGIDQIRLSIKIYKKIGVMILGLVLFITSVNMFRDFFNLGFITAVTLIILPFSSVWAIFIKRLKRYLIYSVKTWKRKTSSLQNFFFLFLSVGFFITMLKETTILSYLQQPFLLASQYPIFLFVMIQIIFLALAMVGFHPLVTFSILAEIIKPILLIISPVSIGLVLIMSSLSTVMAGPYNISVSLTGSMLNTNPYQVSFWNILFALFFSSSGTILALFFL